MWKYNPNEDSDDILDIIIGTGFRIVYVFVSSKLGDRLKDVSSDSRLNRLGKSKISNYSP